MLPTHFCDGIQLIFHNFEICISMFLLIFSYSFLWEYILGQVFLYDSRQVISPIDELLPQVHINIFAIRHTYVKILLGGLDDFPYLLQHSLSEISKLFFMPSCHFHDGALFTISEQKQKKIISALTQIISNIKNKFQICSYQS